jgi:hypothetical protein
MKWGRDYELGRVVKQNGLCFVKQQWRYCPFWRACFRSTVKSSSRVPAAYFCSKFKKYKNGKKSLPECNKMYGPTVIPSDV